MPSPLWEGLIGRHSPHLNALNTQLYTATDVGTTHSPPNVSAEIIPRNLFTFWSPLEDLPEFVAGCLATFHRLNPTWTVYVLYPNVPGVEPPPFQNLNADNDGNWVGLQHTADWYRAAALARYGGVWVDATSIMLRPVESWVDVNSDAVQVRAGEGERVAKRSNSIASLTPPQTQSRPNIGFAVPTPHVAHLLMSS